MSNNLILILDTQNRCKTLMESLISLNTRCEVVNSSGQLAQKLNSGFTNAAVANIHHNDEFELLEHLSKISLTYPEVPLFILVPETIENTLKWGPKVFLLTKPVSAYSILRRLSFFNENSFPYEGTIKGPMLLSLLDHCLFEQKSYAITINYKDIHKAELMIREGKWVSLYIDDSLKNNRLLLPFYWEEVQYRIRKTENAEVGEFEIENTDYDRFRRDFHSWVSLMEQMPKASDRIAIDHEKLANLSGSIPKDVIPLIRLVDGNNDMFSIFLASEQNPWDTAQNLGYLYFSDVLFVINSEASGKRIYSSENSDSRKYRVQKEVFDRFGGTSMISSKPRRSRELANWIMDPAAAARKLEENLKDEIKKHRQLKPEENEFRPRRRTQPGLGELVSSLQDEIEGKFESSTSDAKSGEWGNISSDKQPSFSDIVGFMTQDEDEGHTKPIENKKESDSPQSNDGARSATLEMTSFPDAEDDFEEIDALPGIVIEEDTEMLADESQAMQSGTIEFGKKKAWDEDSSEIIVQIDDTGKPVKVNTIHDDQDEGLPVDLVELRKQAGHPPASSLDELKALREKRRTDGYYRSDSVITNGDDDEDNEEVAELKNIIKKNRSGENNSFGGEYSALEEESADSENLEEKPDKTSEKKEKKEIDPYATERITPAQLRMETFHKDDFNSGSGKKIAFILIAFVVAGIAVWFFFLRDKNQDMKMSDKTSDESAKKIDDNNMKSVNKKPEVMKPAEMKPEKVIKEVIKPVEMKPEKLTPEVIKPEKDPVVEKEILGIESEYRKNGKIKVVEDGAAKYPEATKLLDILAFYYYDRGNLKKARAYAEKAVKTPGDSAEGWRIIGLIEYELGNKDKYLPAFKKFLSLRPNDPKAQKIVDELGIKVK
ncbi:hypothetical protein KKF34_19200 [Myxococcota bacterium]|nr:hypothetical protein [Myxococcota bacterium]MBU1379280.1 hypothetical protein [Myxococcota bacterium]MBU1499016.1 hypothetical protein [Myxococcota bacterium]